MKLPRTKATLLWKTAIRDLSVGGLHPDPEDVVWLWQLADRVFHAPGRRLLFTRAPIILPALSTTPTSPHCSLSTTPTTQTLPPLTLYPITLQAIDWLLAISAWRSGGDLIPAAFACAHSDGADHAILSQTDRNTVETALHTWSNRLPCTPEDLRLAVQIQTATPDALVDTAPVTPHSSLATSCDTSATDWGELLALLSGAYHIAPWELLKRPFRDIEAMMAQLPRVATLYGRVVEDEDRKRALREFQEAVLWVKKGGAMATYRLPDSPSTTEPTISISTKTNIQNSNLITLQSDTRAATE
jgi:hypothetical protein